jgi:hypothetical protein
MTPPAELPPPAGLPRRAAQATQALMEARTCAPRGWVVTAREVHPYDIPDITVQDTHDALIQARDAGLAELSWDEWFPTKRALELRRELEEWYYAT